MSSRKRKEWMETLVFTLPALFLVTMMMYIPFLMSGYYSLTEWNGIAKEPVFIGLANFRELFGSGSSFAGTIFFTLNYTLFFMVFSNIFALALAVALAKKFRGANVFRGLFFVPYIMSMTIVGFIWKFIFMKGFEKLFSLTGLGFLNLSWLGDPSLAFYSVAFVGVWQSLGFYVVLYIAGLKAIPEDILEAAVVDGATPMQKFFRITLPLLGPSVTTCIFMSLTNGLKVFDIILALTKGGPGKATYSTTMQIYQEAFTNNNYGLGSAEAILYFIFVLITTQLVLRIMSRREVDL
ncbi:MAG: sugar ABC transporter permease [Lachnospiraceae bacterium]|nr:sugar ABC transporter permease [Lachnospiraceae bacterium]